MTDRNNPDEFWLELEPERPLENIVTDLDAVVTLPAPELRNSIDDIPPIDRD